MKVKVAAFSLATACLAGSSFGQSTFQVTFDGPPVLAPGTGVVATNYYEAGMFFRPVPGSRSFLRTGPPTDPHLPNNGTAFVQAGFGDSLMFSFTNGSSFSLAAVDLAGYSSVVPDATIQFVGYRTDGSTVTTTVVRHGITFRRTSSTRTFRI